VFRKIMAALLVVALLTACDPEAGRGEYHEWFNPDGKAVRSKMPAKCDGLTKDKHVIPPVPLPPGITDKMNWVEYRLEVFAIKVGKAGKADTNFEFCIPVSIHIYGQANGQSDFIRLMAHGNNITMPHDGLYNTPYVAEAWIGWEKDDLPPTVSWEISANYETGSDFFKVQYEADTIGLMCQIRMNEVLLSSATSLDITAPKESYPDAVVRNQMVRGPFVHCATGLHPAVPNTK